MTQLWAWEDEAAGIYAGATRLADIGGFVAKDPVTP